MSSESVNRRAFLNIVAGAATGAAVGCRMPEDASAEKAFAKIPDNSPQSLAGF